MYCIHFYYSPALASSNRIVCDTGVCPLIPSPLATPELLGYFKLFSTWNAASRIEKVNLNSLILTNINLYLNSHIWLVTKIQIWTKCNLDLWISHSIALVFMAVYTGYLEVYWIGKYNVPHQTWVQQTNNMLKGRVEKRKLICA